MLYRRTRKEGSYQYSLAVLKAMREEVMRAHHDASAGRHYGRKRRLARMKRLY